MNSLQEILSNIGYHKNAISLNNSSFNAISFDMLKIIKMQNLYENLVYAYAIEQQIACDNFKDLYVHTIQNYSYIQIDTTSMNTAALTIKDLIDNYMIYRRRPVGVSKLNRIRETNMILGNEYRDIYDIKCEEFINILSKIHCQLKTFF